jgi:hypothetical protein
MKLTRRQLVAVLAPAAALAQTQPAEDALAAAKAKVKATSDALAKLDLPMSTEPAFQFRA